MSEFTPKRGSQIGAGRRAGQRTEILRHTGREQRYQYVRDRIEQRYQGVRDKRSDISRRVGQRAKISRRTGQRTEISRRAGQKT